MAENAQGIEVHEAVALTVEERLMCRMALLVAAGEYFQMAYEYREDGQVKRARRTQDLADRHNELADRIRG